MRDRTEGRLWIDCLSGPYRPPNPLEKRERYRRLRPAACRKWLVHSTDGQARWNRWKHYRRLWPIRNCLKYRWWSLYVMPIVVPTEKPIGNVHHTFRLGSSVIFGHMPMTLAVIKGEYICAKFSRFWAHNFLTNRTDCFLENLPIMWWNSSVWFTDGLSRWKWDHYPPVGKSLSVYSCNGYWI